MKNKITWGNKRLDHRYFLTIDGGEVLVSRQDLDLAKTYYALTPTTTFKSQIKQIVSKKLTLIGYDLISDAIDDFFAKTKNYAVLEHGGKDVVLTEFGICKPKLAKTIHTMLKKLI